MLRKLISAVMVIACLFMLVAGAFGIRDIMQEKSDGEKEKAATLEKLDTLKAGKEKLESNRADYEPMARRLTRRARPIMQRVSRI